MQTLTRSISFTVPAAPERVFPLLCPVLEYRWLVNWRCDLLHSTSGVAEEDCVFRTTLPSGNPMTWVVSRYEPPTRIEFTCFDPAACAFRLKVALAAEGDSTRLDWTHRWLSVGPAGDAWIAGRSEPEHQKSMDFLRRALTHYLATGEMFQP
jgi:uncharacterized protein YndB with AHSA1/START domain